VNEKMEDETQQRVNAYAQLLEEIRQQVNDVQIAIAILQEVTKDQRMTSIREERKVNGDYPATEKQLAYLKNLGVEADANMTKQQASSLIDEMLAKPKVSVEKIPARVP